MTAPVSAVLITRDDLLLEQAIASIRPYVAELVVVDTGSTDLRPIADLLHRSNGDSKLHKFTDCNDAEGHIADFSAARNYAFSLVTQPWVLWLDADDLIAGGENLASVIHDAERLHRRGHDVRVFAPYEYAYDGDGDCCTLLGRERIVNRDAFRWERPVHESLVPIRPARLHDLTIDSIVWKHQKGKLKTGERDVGRNKRILTAIKDPDQRAWYDLGVELLLESQVTGDLETEHRASECLFAAAGFDRVTSTARAQALLKLGELAFRRALRAVREDKPVDHVDATRALLDAAALVRWDQPYIELAKVAYATAHERGLSAKAVTSRLEQVIEYGEAAVNRPATPMPHPRNPLDRALHLHCWLHDAYARLGKMADARFHLEEAIAAKPNDPHLRLIRREYAHRQGLTVILQQLESMRAVQAVDDATSEIIRSALEEPATLKERLRSVPSTFVRDPNQTRNWFRIVFSCGNSLEPWGPTTASTRGLGGSETAVVEMAKRLAARGHSVRVYCSCEAEGTFDRVDYRRAGKVAVAEPCDILIAWRNAALLEPEAGPPIVGARILWVHDIDPIGASYGRLLKADRVFALSAWHRKHLIDTWGLHPNHVVQTRNGIDPNRFDIGGIARNPHKVIYSSSPDRGLGTLLDMWPTVRRGVPDAELHVLYGFDMWWRAADAHMSRAMHEEIAALETRARAIEGVVLRGRLTQDDVAREMLSAGVWVHPSRLANGEPFHETSCIGAMEAHSAGLQIVATSCGALKETCGAQSVYVRYVHPNAPDWDNLFGSFIITALHTGGGEEGRCGFAKVGQARFDWDGLPTQWESVFAGALEDAQSGALPPFLSVFSQEEAAQ